MNMDSKQILKNLLIAQWIVLFAAIFIGVIERQYLPDSLKVYLEEITKADMTLAETVNFFVITIALVAYLISSVGLLFYKGWGRWLYLYSTIVGFVVGPLLGPTIGTPFAGTLDDLCSVLVGLTIGVIYFSDAKKLFEG
jgi:predicted ferric reductase